MNEFAAIDPSTGAPIGSPRPFAGEPEIELALAEASAAFASWSQVPIRQRCARIAALAEALRGDRAELAEVAVAEMGKPIAQALAEVDKCALACDFAAEHGPEWLSFEPVETEARVSGIEHRPLGPILAIMPWNFPYWQLFRFAASAWVAGNPVLLKHAPNVPGCAEAIARVALRAGLPPGVFGNLFAPVEAMERILGDDRVAGVTLTGSTRAGRAVAEIAGRHLKPSVLELGGSDPFLVLADADVARAARVGATARLQNNGQSCIAAKRFIVVEAVAKPFVEAFQAALAAAVVGDPRDPATTLGPMARADLRDALHGVVQSSVAAGARCVLGGELPDRGGWWYPATLLLDGRPGVPAWDDETFGPVAIVAVAKDEAEAIALANATPYALGASVWTADLSRARKIAGMLRGGAVFANAMVKSDPRVPFGGVGLSGWGRELGREGMRSFTASRTLWLAD